MKETTLKQSLYEQLSDYVPRLYKFEKYKGIFKIDKSGKLLLPPQFTFIDNKKQLGGPS